MPKALKREGAPLCARENPGPGRPSSPGTLDPLLAWAPVIATASYASCLCRLKQKRFGHSVVAQWATVQVARKKHAASSLSVLPFLTPVQQQKGLLGPLHPRPRVVVGPQTHANFPQQAFRDDQVITICLAVASPIDNDATEYDAALPPMPHTARTIRKSSTRCGSSPLSVHHPALLPSSCTC